MSEEHRSQLHEGLVVEFAGTEFIIEKLKLNEHKVDLKQNFSIGLVYEDILLDEIKLFKEPRYNKYINKYN